MVDSIPAVKLRRELGPFETIYSGWLTKKGHQVKVRKSLIICFPR